MFFSSNLLFFPAMMSTSRSGKQEKIMQTQVGIHVWLWVVSESRWKTISSFLETEELLDVTCLPVGGIKHISPTCPLCFAKANYCHLLTYGHPFLFWVSWYFPLSKWVPSPCHKWDKPHFSSEYQSRKFKKTCNFEILRHWIR